MLFASSVSPRYCLVVSLVGCCKKTKIPRVGSVGSGNNGGWDRFSKGLQIQQSNRFSVAIDFPGSNGTDGSDWTQLLAAKLMLWPS